MPRKDGAGPEGKGPKTGRGAGNCVVKNNKNNKIPLKPQRRGRQGRNLK